ncbi:cytochrome c oxidase assembly protein [Longimicrobium sp.]|uniref:cytochrome c oxidase assembly protein n=1 Tax=Longimicrobium sp. TaxID=2029185 RepID=UPI002E360527|nr:cytochrome c oxidase assembly protein [Longimicrobium sp.]HEX6040750.1 cytochrome c oxidase assembly protein [Longimicrobium sp.]
MFNAVLGLALLHGETFSWSEWRVYPSFMAGWLLLGGGYFLLIGPLRHRFAGAHPVPAKKVASFVAGLALMFVALQGPMHELSDYFLFSAHMVQHLVLILIMPPFLLYGTPDWALRPLVRRKWVGRIARALTLPLVAFALNNVIFLAWHFPGPYDLMMRDHGVHVTMHLMIMVTGTIMWWPVMSPLPELPRIAPVLQMVYLFLVGIPMMISAALITFSQTELYGWYVEAPRIVPGLSALEDQRLGGVIMWVPGGLTLWLAITFVYFRWTQRERRLDEGVSLRQPAVSRSGLIVPPPYPQG